MINKDRFFYLIDNNCELDLKIFLEAYNKLIQIDPDFKPFITEKSDNDHDGLFLAAHKNYLGIASQLIKQDVVIDSLNLKNEHTPLSNAALKGHTEMVKLLALAGADINYVVGDESPLFSATLHGREDVVDCLLSLGADPNLGQISSGCTPLIGAIIRGHLAIAKKLLPKSNIQLTMLNGTTALHAAAEKGDRELIEQLSKIDTDLNKRTTNGLTALHTAALNNNTQAFNALIDLGADYTIPMPDGNTLIHIAASRNCIPILQKLTEKQANINALAHNGNTPICQAAKNGHEEAMQFLLQNGANPNLGRSIPIAMSIQEGHQKAFDLLIKWRAYLKHSIISDQKIANLNHVAVSNNRATMLDVLITQGVDKDACLGTESVAWMAAWHGYVECLSVLKKHGANFNFLRKNDGISLLDAAAYNGHVAAICLLLDSGQNINGTSSGFTPLYFAVQNGHVAAAHLLISRGAIVDLSTRGTSETALHAAARNGHIQAIKLLIEAKAKINVRRINGATPLYVAAIGNQYDVVKLLLDKGADSEIPLHDGSNLIEILKQRGMSRIITLFSKKLSFSERLKDYQGEIDEEFLDPIMKEIMDDPVMLSNGMIVNFATFNRFEKTHDGKIKNPHDRNTFLLPTAYPCINLKTKIADFVIETERKMQNQLDNGKTVQAHSPFFTSRNYLSVEQRKLILDLTPLLSLDGGKSNIIKSIKLKEYPSAIQEACTLGRTDILNLISSHLQVISKDLLVTSINTAMHRGMTSLHVAAIEANKTKDLGLLKALCNYGGDLARKDDENKTPLDYLSPDQKIAFLTNSSPHLLS